MNMSTLVAFVRVDLLQSASCCDIFKYLLQLSGLHKYGRAGFCTVLVDIQVPTISRVGMT